MGCAAIGQAIAPCRCWLSCATQTVFSLAWGLLVQVLAARERRAEVLVARVPVVQGNLVQARLAAQGVVSVA